jgi:two-component system OmpR family sensor kinase
MVSPLPAGRFLIVATPLAPIHRILEDLTTSLQVVGAVVLAILGLFIWAVIRSANRRIDQMIDVAARVGSGDLSARVGDAAGATEAARLAHALNAMTAQLEDASAARAESDERLRRFVADASHELRTPLATIRGYSQLHRAGALTDPDDSSRAMGRIESETARMGQLVEEMLLLARLDQGHALRFEPVDLRLLVANAVADARAREPDRDIDLALPPRAVIIDGDEARLQQAIDNLLANAQSHTPAPASVRVELMAEADALKIIVSDDGPGMEASQAAKAFDRFYRAESSRTRSNGGSGLGLAIVASIVEAHAGTVDLSTQPGEGATFTISLPYAHVPDGAARG